MYKTYKISPGSKKHTWNAYQQWKIHTHFSNIYFPWSFWGTSVDDKPTKQCEKYKCGTKWSNVEMAPSQQYLLISITCYVVKKLKENMLCQKNKKDEIFLHTFNFFFLLHVSFCICHLTYWGIIVIYWLP